MKPNKIAILLHEFPALTETFILNQIIFLIKRGIDVQIFSLYPGPLDNLHSQYQGYGLEYKITTVANIPKSWRGRLTEVMRFLKNDGFWLNFAPLIKCLSPINFGVSGLKLTYFIYYSRLKGINEYDLVHAHFGNVGAFFAKFVSLGLFEGLPYMVSFHGYDLAPNQTEKNKKLYRQLFRSSKLFTVNSFYMRGILERIDKEINFRVKVLPMGVDISFFNKLNYPVKIVQNEVYSIIYVGRLVDLKGPDTAIEIVNRVVHDFGLNKIELTIIGNGPLQDNLETKVLEKGLTGHVRLLGGQDQSIVSAILSQGDLFVYTGRVQQVTNRAETQGLVLIEAQAMGLPVLAFDVGGVGESILNGETGILIPAGDVDEFARLLVILLNDSERRLKMGISARKFIKDNFDSAVLGKKLLDIYDEVLG